MLIIPFSSERKSAEILESEDLIYNVKKGLDFILNPPEYFETPWVAKYTLICMNNLTLRGFTSPVSQDKILQYLKGAPEKPRWLDRFHSQHRAYLVLLGWVRHLKKHDPDFNTKTISDHEDLLSYFRSLDPGGTRQYQHFKEAPAAYKLHP